MTDLRTRLERKHDEAPRKLLMPERVESLERAKKALTGITVDAQTEPAHWLVDAAVQQAADSTKNEYASSSSSAYSEGYGKGKRAGWR